MATFLGTDVDRIVKANSVRLTERLIDELTDQGTEINPEKLREICKGISVEFTEHPCNPDFEGFIRRYDKISDMLSIDDEDGIELDVDDVEELREMMTYTFEFVKLMEYIRIHHEGVINNMKRLICK